MLDFHSPKLGDIEWVRSALRHSKHKGCYYTFATMYSWALRYNTEIAGYKDMLFSRGGKDQSYYIYPVGKYDVSEAISLISEDAASRGIDKLTIIAEEWQKEELEAAFPERFECVLSRDDCDYVYNSSDLIDLAGRKYHGKRNHISKFKRNYENYTYEDITESSIPECMEVLRKWCDGMEIDYTNEIYPEYEAIRRCFADMELLGIIGGLIRVSGSVVAFTLGERLNEDTFVVHFEKAIPDFGEAYTVINQSFAERRLKEYKYINREEDLGMEGLRKAKLSYNPAFLVNKYYIKEL
ncbi:MAG: phosphatidylglycerol lysyltransferase domain-containing protein [Oscillospiraceae bacterium]|jgi:hypothetical protein|nr:phosphatidylglycerol lysyltransferase domain-containing protein [Oscillospiraceae bacterium]